jgi:hypothetical protein
VTDEIVDCTANSSLMSHCHVVATGQSFRRSDFALPSSCSSLARIASLACSRASRRANASPNPREPPMMTITFCANESRGASYRNRRKHATVATTRLERFFKFMSLQLIQLMFACPPKRKLSGLGSGIGMKGSHSLERVIPKPFDYRYQCSSYLAATFISDLAN